jgi:voltage-gated potassium channel
MGHDPLAVAINSFLVAIICLNVVAVAAETVPSVWARFGAALERLAWLSIAVFAAEYVLRIWSAAELPFSANRNRWSARLIHAGGALQVVDLLAFLPAGAAMLLVEDQGTVSALRLLCFLKLARYSPALHSLGRVIAAERGALLGALLVMLSFLLLAGTGMYLIERDVQPIVFGTLPNALWWALVTLATVGYGDAIPLTPTGRLFTAVMIICGVAVYALPIGIIATGFAQELTRRDFMVTWTLLARVPLFAGLDAAAVAQIMTLLESRTYEAGEQIVRAGEPGESMFFIASGEVIVAADHGEVRLGQGEFFGEMSILEHRPRGHNVSAASYCRLLLLNRDDFERMGRRHPHILDQIKATAAKRGGKVDRE